MRHALRVIGTVFVLGFVIPQLAGCGTPDEKAQSHFESGKKLLQQNETAKAAIEFKNALKLKKDHVGAWRELAKIEEGKQNWQGLAAILRTVADLDPKDINVRLQLARLTLLGNALDEASKWVNAAVELDPRNVTALTLKAAALLKLNDTAGALREARAALAVDPASSEAVIVLAAERLAAGDRAAALAQLNQAVSAADNFGLQLFRMKIYEQMGNLAEVESLLRKFADLYPNDPSFRRQLVKLYVNQKRMDDAEKEVRAIAAVNSADVEAGLDVVRFLHSFKGVASARSELMARINKGGEAFPYQIALAEYYFAEQNYADSEQLLEKLASNTSTPAQALNAKIKLAEMHLSRRKVEAAEGLVTDILKKDARNAAGLKLRATLQMERGQIDAAVADLRQGLNDQPRATDLMSLLAVAYERGGSIELADKQYADAMRVADFDAAVALNYVNFLRRRGNVARAEDVLSGLANRWPTNGTVLTALAEVRLIRQNWIGAQEVADAIKRIGNDQGLANQLLATALNGQNKYDESIGLLQSAYDSSTGAQPLVALVSTLVRANKTDRAVAFLETILKKDPSNAEAHVLLGSTHLARNAPSEAATSFKAAISQQPKNVAGYRALADLHLRDKKFDAALTVIRSGLKEQPDNAILRLSLAGALEVGGDYDGAIAEYEQILKQQPGSMVAMNNLASLLSDYRSDKPSLDRAYALALGLRKSQVPHFKDTLGWVHYQRGEHKAAVTLLEEAASELPDVAMVRYHLGASYAAAGQPAKATEQLKKALELGAPNNMVGDKIRLALQQTTN